MLLHKTVTVVLPEEVWELVRETQVLVNKKLNDKTQPALNVSGIISAIVRHAMLDNAGDIQHEHEEVGCDQLAVRLTDILGRDGVAALGLPQAARTSKPHRVGVRKTVAYLDDSSSRPLPGTAPIPPRSNARRRPGAPRQV